MTKKETAEIISMMQLNYPDSFRGKSDQVVAATINLWFMQFRDDAYMDVMTAVMAHIATDTNRFMPPVGVIKEKLVEIRMPEEMTEIEAWNMVRNAIRSYPWDAKKEFDKLPPVLQRLVGSSAQLVEWGQMDAETVASVVASNFQRSYKVRASREKELLALPSAVRQTMEQIADRMKMPELPRNATETELEQQRQEQIRRLEESCVTKAT